MASITSLLKNVTTELAEIDQLAEETVMAILELANADSIAEIGKRADPTELKHALLEQCTFHDIITQRIGKIRRYLDGVDGALEPGIKTQKILEDSVHDGLLEGPQAKGAGMSQDAIDDMF